MYRADGTKLRKLTNLTQQDGEFATITEYIDGFHYLTTQGTPDNNVNPVYYAYEQEAFIEEVQLSPNETALRFFPTAEGFFDFGNNEYIYQYKDHLGNVRLSYKNNGDGKPEVTDSNDYYPFGMSFVRNSEEDAHFGAGSYKNYKYQEQELQETGFYFFKWRQYMPDVGRFFNIDPLAEKYPYNSTYAFQENKMGLGRELEGLELVRDYRHAPSSSVIVTTKPVTKLTHWTNASLYFVGVASMPRYTDVVTTQSKTSFIYKNDRGQTVGSKSDASYLTVHQEETKFINDQSSLTTMSEVSTAIKQTSQIFEDYTIKNGELKQVDSDSTPIVSATPINLSDAPKGHQITVTKANNENTKSSNNQMIDIAKQKSTDANNNHWGSMEIPKKELERVPEAVKNPW